MSKENMSVKVRQIQGIGRHADAGLLQAGRSRHPSACHCGNLL